MCVCVCVCVFACLLMFLRFKLPFHLSSLFSYMHSSSEVEVSFFYAN